MSKTIVIQIGNSDDKLTQSQWAYFVMYLRMELESPALDFHFFGFSASDAHWQNCCMVFNADYERLGYEDFETYLNDLRFILANVARKYKQDSIALLVGETEFVPFNYESKEIQDALSGNSEEDSGQDREEGSVDGEEGGLEAAQVILDRRQEDRHGLHIVGPEGLEGGRSLYPG